MAFVGQLDPMPVGVPGCDELCALFGTNDQGRAGIRTGTEVHATRPASDAVDQNGLLDRDPTGEFLLRDVGEGQASGVHPTFDAVDGDKGPFTRLGSARQDLHASGQTSEFAISATRPFEDSRTARAGVDIE